MTHCVVTFDRLLFSKTVVHVLGTLLTSWFLKNLPFVPSLLGVHEEEQLAFLELARAIVTPYDNMFLCPKLVFKLDKQIIQER